MNAKRNILGSEMMEVAVTAGIILCFSIAAVAVFGPTVATVFESDKSPIMKSAEGMQNSSDPDDPTGTGSRTNFDKSLVTSKLITKAHSDTSIGSAVGQETTGATGGDAAIGGTYTVDDPDALYDGDPSTTGNALLDAALAAKDSALDLINDAASAESIANLLDEKVNHLLDEVSTNQAILVEMNESLNALSESSSEVNAHLDLLKQLKATAEGISVNVYDALNFTTGVNLDILSQTNMNLVSGQGLLNLNQDQIAAYNEYLNLQTTYDNSWVTTSTTDADGNVTTSTINTSGISPSQISAQYNFSSMLLSQVEGQAMALQTSINSLSTSTAAMQTAASEALSTAQDLEAKSKDTLKKAFKDGSIFDGCTTIQQMIDTAQTALGSGGHQVKNYHAAYDAISLLKQAGVAYQTTKQLEAQATQLQNNLTQQQTTLSELNVDAASLSLSANQQDTASILSTQSATIAVIAGSDPEIAMVARELSTVNQAVNTTTSMINTQQVYTEALADNAAQVQAEALQAQQTAAQLNVDATSALQDANQVIDDIVQFPGE